jgi:Helix-turn-helix domain
MAGPLLTLPRAASRLGVSIETMRREVARPDGPPTIAVGSRRLIDPADLEQWCERRRRRSDAPPVPDRAA